MDTKELIREAVRAGALGEAERATELIDQIPEDHHLSFSTYVTAVFCGVVEYRFMDDQSIEAITSFVDEMRDDFSQLDPPLKPMTVEALIRIFFGEDQMVDEVDGAEQLHYQLLVIRKVVHESPELQKNIDQLLTEAQLLIDSMD